MPWQQVKRALDNLVGFLQREKIRIPKHSTVAAQLEISVQFCHDFDVLGEDAAVKKWMKEDFKQFYDAIIVSFRLSDAITILAGCPGDLRSRVAKTLIGPLSQNFDPGPAKDTLFELEIAATFRRGGFVVLLEEPDIVVDGNGLTQKIGLACKFPSSESQLHSHISKGYRQINTQNLAGCVVLGLEQIITSAVHGQSVPPFFDFRQGSRHPQEVVNKLMKDCMTSLRYRRSEDYPSERPLDGAILSMSLWGLFGPPPGIVNVTAWSVQCRKDNPIRLDLELIVDRLSRLVAGDVPTKPQDQSRK